MTSKQVVLSVMLSLMASLCGCTWNGGDTATLVSPSKGRQVWAVAPLRNESGSMHADGSRLADHLAQQLEGVKGIDVLPVNRVLAAMDSLHMSDVTTKADAAKLRKTLGADGLVIGTISAYHPYDPPKLGMAIELYTGSSKPDHPRVNPRQLTQAATEGDVTDRHKHRRSKQPVAAVSGFYDAASPAVRSGLREYAHHRGVTTDSPENWRLYRISMDLNSEYVSHAMVAKLIKAEAKRKQVASAHAGKTAR